MNTVCEGQTDGFGLYTTSGGVFTPYKVDVQVGNDTLTMEVDTGASRSTVDEHVYRNKLSNYALEDANVTLTSYTGTNVPLLGCISVPVQYNGNKHCLDLVVVKGRRPSLLGRDWLSKIKLNWSSICKITSNESKLCEKTDPDCEQLLQKYNVLFGGGKDGIRHFTAKLSLKQGARKVFHKDRPVPYSLITEVEAEYDRLIERGILYPVKHSEWASAVVHVPKARGSVRVCGDYKGVNEVIEDDNYKLPNAQDMLAKIAQSGKSPNVYSLLDLQGAFNQLRLDSESAKLLVLNTHKGLLGTDRLCFGVKTAPAQFQATMDSILSGLKNVFCYIDDILVVSESKSEHLKVLAQVFERLADYNVKLNKDKCEFLKSKVQYLGHVLSANGVQPVQGKVEALLKAPRPRNVHELKSLLGAINYYGKFLPDLATTLHPLYQLSHHDARWVWSPECEEAFNKIKQMLVGAEVLIHFDAKKPLVLGVDASPYGLGAVLSHRLADGSERPIAYASRTLSAAERNYAQIEKEGLAIIFGVKKFHMYLYGTRFSLVTDHQPLTRIFGPKTGIPPLAAARMQRWALILAGYTYDIEYRSSENNANADLLSRLPMPGKQDNDPEEEYVFNTLADSLPITAKRISAVTAKDPVLSKVFESTASGWPAYCDDEVLEPYWRLRHELTIDSGCVLWGRRVIIPEKLQTGLMEELHDGHPGMTRMKAIARSFVWWPGIDADVEDWVRRCAACVSTQGSPKAVPLLLWPWATEPWQRIHVDFLEITGLQYLLVVDSHSKWMEVFPMSSTTAVDTVTVMRSLFARYGLANEVVTDNGPQFIAAEFKNFLAKNSVKHTLCPPYHPASNGLAERHVQTFKHMFKKCESGTDIQHKVADVLFRYRNTPHSTTGSTPAELFLKRTPKTRLSLVKPNLQGKVEQRQASSKQHHDGRHPKMRSYDLFQRVRVRNKRGGKEKWIPGTVVQVKGPSTYVVRVPGNNHRFVHADHLIADDSTQVSQPVTTPPVDLPAVSGTGAIPEVSIPPPIVEASRIMAPEVVKSPSSRMTTPSVNKPSSTPATTKSSTPATPKSATPVKTSKSGRVIKAPNRLTM
jgi:hypothetical protein